MHNFLSAFYFEKKERRKEEAWREGNGGENEQSMNKGSLRNYQRNPNSTEVAAKNFKFLRILCYQSSKTGVRDWSY